MNGKMDDCRVYDRALSAAEILNIFQAQGRDGIIDGLQFQVVADGAPGSAAGGTDIGPNAFTPSVSSVPSNEESILTLGRGQVQVG